MFPSPHYLLHRHRPCFPPSPNPPPHPPKQIVPAFSSPQASRDKESTEDPRAALDSYGNTPYIIAASRIQEHDDPLLMNILNPHTVFTDLVGSGEGGGQTDTDTDHADYNASPTRSEKVPLLAGECHA